MDTFETYHRGRSWRDAAAAAVVAMGLAYSVLRWRPFRVEIRGSSMAPALEAGDWALAVRRRRIRRGDVVVFAHPERPGLELVKRVVALPGELAPDGGILEADRYWVEGDRAEGSTDSRRFGPVARGAIAATVRLVYWPPSRRRLL
ncbi:MAG: signal peptidase I [Candidatus Velamenicoccus archaeovorus]